MQQLSALSERIRALKAIAESMHEGAIHTQLFPEVDKVLALPEQLDGLGVGELEAVGRQVREYEQAFDALGYSLLEQIMPATGVSQVFQLVRAAEAFTGALKDQLGRPVPAEAGTRPLTRADCRILTRHSLSIGTPPATAATRDLVGRILYGRPAVALDGLVDTTAGDRLALREFFQHCVSLVDGSLHYATPGEERAFLDAAARFVNFEGGQLFNRAVVTESPERVIQLIERHLFDKFGPHGERPLVIVETEDALDDTLLARMHAEPNRVFVARVTRLPHHLLRTTGQTSVWREVMGRLLLVDASDRARRSNTTLVFTLFPHVARTLRNIQTALAGRPANSQLQLRLLLERFSPDALASLRNTMELRLAELDGEGVWEADTERLRTEPRTRDALHQALTLKKLVRLLAFLERVARSDADDRAVLGGELRAEVADAWMAYFYKSLPREVWPATVVPGGGRGALAAVGEWFRREVRAGVERFAERDLATCRERLASIKAGLDIPDPSTDEIEAGARQSQLRGQAPTEWTGGERARRMDYLARTLGRRAADVAGRAARLARAGVDRMAFGNLGGGPAALVQQAMSRAGFDALHGRLEDAVSGPVGRMDRRMRQALLPLKDAVRAVQRTMDEVRGETDPTEVAEIEEMLDLLAQRRFPPILLLPRLSWTYADVFPEKDFPAARTLRLTLDRRHELSPAALLSHLEQQRYRLRRFPELFELLCRSSLLVLNSPNNPTGVVYRRETVLQLLHIAAEYGLTVVDDNSYHKVVSRPVKARQGDASVAQLYERYRDLFPHPVRILTAAATTKGLQGAGDRTGLIHGNVPEAVSWAEENASDAHLLSLYLTRQKLETGLAAKAATRSLERMSARLLDPTVEAAVPTADLLAEWTRGLHRDETPVPVFETMLEVHESLLRLSDRGAGRRQLSEGLSRGVARLKRLRLEKGLRGDVERRQALAQRALERCAAETGQRCEAIRPGGAFYQLVRLCPAGEDQGAREFLLTLCRYRKVDAMYAGDGWIRVSLGGWLEGDDASYEAFGRALEVYLRLVLRYWQAFTEAGRDLGQLEALLRADDDDGWQRLVTDLGPLLPRVPAPVGPGLALPIAPSERGTVYAIEEGRSVTDKIFIELAEPGRRGGTGRAAQPCRTVEELLSSRPFRVVYRRLLRKVHGRVETLAELTPEQVELQYGPLACRAAYSDRQLIDAPFRALVQELHAAWHGESTVRVLSARLEAEEHDEKVAALHGLNEQLDGLVDQLAHAFQARLRPGSGSAFEIGFEALDEVRASSLLPDYLRRLIERTVFAGATAPLNPSPRFVTGAAKRVADHRYQFNRRDAADGPPAEHFRHRLDGFARQVDPSDWVCKAVQVGPFKMLLAIHKADFHLVNDELRLFPQIAEVQRLEAVDGLRWDAALVLGLPTTVIGESYKTGYFHDRTTDGRLLPVAWVAREDATDYVGFLKKSLLTLHNQLVKAMGGLPVHGAMITITFKNGLRKTLVFSADSGTGKSETITAMMEQLASGSGQAAEMRGVDILAGDMLSVWRGEDGQLYALGTETGDFLRLTDISETWKARFGDLLERGSYSNLHHPKNPRVTLPGICNARLLLSPTRVNGFFYIDNYSAPSGRAVELSDDPRQVLKQVLVRGLRKNKGTSGDQPSLRAGLEHAGRSELVSRFHHALDELLDWQEREVDGRTRTCLVYRDGSGNPFAAREMVRLAFRGRRFQEEGRPRRILATSYDVMENVFRVTTDAGDRRVLDREVYDQIYEPLVSTFCGNPFVDPEGMDRVLDAFAEAMRGAKVHTGAIKTQLAREGQAFDGPARAARDVVAFLLEDEEVNARFQRNKDKVHRAMRSAYGRMLPPGSNLPVELEGYNLLRLEAHESTHVAFVASDGELFTLSTPYYRHEDRAPLPPDTPFVPALMMPEVGAAIADVCANPDYDLELGELEVRLSDYSAIEYWNDLDELTWQVCLVDGVVGLGASEADILRFPWEVRKARRVAQLLAELRAPRLGATRPWTPERVTGTGPAS